MPSHSEPVRVPEDLQRRGIGVEVREPRPIDGETVRDILAIIMIFIGFLCSTLGVAYWLQPSAGLAILGDELFVVGCLMGNKR
jgi:hypothetical protein